MLRLRSALIWLVLAAVIGIPFVAASMSPLLAWRSPVYIVAGFAGIFAFTLLLIQPLLAIGFLPGLTAVQSRRIHQWAGGVLFLSVLVHVVGLWITSPPDVIDALLFSSPTPFSVWGVIAMWGVFAAAGMVIFRQRVGLRLPVWRFIHKVLAVVVVISSVIHAMQIEGTMEVVSKTILCALVIVTTGMAIARLYLRSERRE